MSKKEHEYYYTFTSPPIQGSSSSNFATPSAPPDSTSQAPPSYDEAIIPSDSATVPSPPPNKPSLDGYVLNTSSPPFNPNIISHHSTRPMPTPQLINTGDYDETNTPNSNINSTIEIDVPLLSDVDHDNNENPNFAGRPSPPGYSLYKATYKATTDGVLSRDKHINSDGEALLQFLYQHNDPPQMSIHFYGYHEETRWTTRTHRNSDGEVVQEQEPTTTRVEDFSFDLDCSMDISNVCQGMYVLPDPKTGEAKTIRELCDQYIHEKNVLKELKLKKELVWDYNSLTQALTTAIRNAGFYDNVEIHYIMKNNEIVVKTEAAISRWVDNKFIRFFFFITCLWAFAWPLIWMHKKKFGHSTLKSAWNMNISERDWYNTHIQEILNSCRGRSYFGTRNSRIKPRAIFHTSL